MMLWQLLHGICTNCNEKLEIESVIFNPVSSGDFCNRKKSKMWCKALFVAVKNDVPTIEKWCEALFVAVKNDVPTIEK